MRSYLKKNLAMCICACVALVHLLITFRTDKLIFTVSPSENQTDYIICKILLFALLLAVYYGIYRFVACGLLVVFSSKTDSAKPCGLLAKLGKKSESAKPCELFEVVMTALPYLIVIAAIAYVKLPQGYLSNDEALIADGALRLAHDTWFYYITTYFYIVCFMLIPTYLAPVYVKLVIEFLVVGYVVYRMKKAFGRPYGYLGYVLFLMYPVLAYTTSAHRLPIYFLLYLTLMCMLIFDGIEKADITWKKTFGILILGAVLTQWRTEGIYLAVIVPVLMLFVYPVLRKKRNLILLVLTTLMIQYVVSIPQNGLVANEMGAAADDRMKPFYAYTITNMFRSGLDREKNAEDLAIVDRYLSIDRIDAINDYYGDINYEDVLILYQSGYVGVREEATSADFFEYANALKRIFKNNIGVFLKTRVGAFCYAALPYHIETGNGIVSMGISLVKSLFYNLFIPLGIIAVLCLYALVRRRWFSFFLTGGLLAHWFIVFILAPASYFKYYFPVYIMAYFYVLALLTGALVRKKGEIRILW